MDGKVEFLFSSGLMSVGIIEFAEIEGVVEHDSSIG